MAKSYRTRVSQLNTALAKSSSKDVFAILDKLKGGQETISHLCARIRASRQEKDAYVERLKKGLFSFLIKMVTDDDFTNLRKFASYLSTDFIGYPYLHENFVSLVQIVLASPNQSHSALAFFIVAKINRADRHLAWQAILEGLGKERTLESLLEYIASNSTSQLEGLVTFFEQNRNLLGPFLVKVLDRIEYPRKTNEHERLAALFDRLYLESPLRVTVEPMLLLFYVTRHSLFEKKPMTNIKKRIASYILQADHELVISEIHKLKTIEKEVKSLQKEVDEKIHLRLARNEPLQDELREQREQVVGEEQRFFAQWKDEVLAKLLGKVCDAYVVLEDVMRDIASKDVIDVRKASEVEEIRASMKILDGTLRSYNVIRIGNAGEIVEYDSKLHDGYVSRGARPVRALRSGFAMADGEGKRRYVIRKAIVKSVGEEELR